jgi:hypothetical protein
MSKARRPRKRARRKSVTVRGLARIMHRIVKAGASSVTVSFGAISITMPAKSPAEQTIDVPTQDARSNKP